MAYSKYMIYPVEHALSAESPSLHLPYPYASWGSKNGRIEQKSWKKRWGYNTADRTLTGHLPYSVILYQTKSGSRYTMYLTATDLCCRTTGTSETFSYKTETYTTGTIDSITGTAVVGTDTTWEDSGIEEGDYFIMNSDHSANIEPDANWVAIASVTDNTHLTLASSYTKNGTGYKIRKIYSVPSNERWSWCMVDDKLVITNGNTDVQYWAASGYAADIETALTVATKARYCIEYADRLFIADYGSTRAPTGIAWSANGDPTDWTSSTAGSATLLGTDNYIMGLGKVGNDLIVYRLYSIMVGNRTGDAVTPVIFPREYKEVECAAPWSIVDAAGSNFFIGRNDFYRLSPGPSVVSIGGPIRDKFFSIVDWTEIEKTWGQHYALRGEVEWIANTAEGKFGFVYNYKMNEWAVNEYRHDICAAGKGAV